MAAPGEEDAAGHALGQAEVCFEGATSPPSLVRTRVDWAEHCLALDDCDKARELAGVAGEAIGELESTVTRSRSEAILAEWGAKS